MGRKTRIVGASGILVAIIMLLLFYEPIEEGRCTLRRRKADPESRLIALAVQFITPLDNKPNHARHIPEDFEKPRYYEVKSGDRSVLMAADYSRKQVRLCIDADSDGILSEERCFTARVSEETPVSGRRQQIGPISLVAADSISETDAAFYINCFREDPRGLLMPRPAFYRVGKLCLAGRTYRVALVDGDRDGLYKSTLSLPLEHFAIKPGKTTSIRLGPPFAVKAEVQQVGTGTVSISPVLVGCSGEQYMAGLKQGRRGLSPIAFKIVNEKGTVLVNDKFKYG